VSAEHLAIAQVSPFAWEASNDLHDHIQRVSEELIARGHRVVVIAPSISPELVLRSRKQLRGDAAALLTGDGPEPTVLGVGEVLHFRSRGRRPASLPVDVARTVEEAMERLPLDIVHVHDPYAPSAPSVALRTSRALNVATFHAPSEHQLWQWGRPLTQMLYNRLDARLVSYAATGALLQGFFPGDYRVVAPAADPLPAAEPGAVVVPAGAGTTTDPAPTLRIAFVADEEHASLRLFLRALRALPDGASWQARICSPRALATPATLSQRLRRHLRFNEDPSAYVERALADSDVIVLASAGQHATPSLIVRALRAGVVPIASGLPVYDELLAEDSAGLLFSPGDSDTLAAHLQHLLEQPARLASLKAAALEAGKRYSYARLADELEDVYGALAARRHDRRARNEQARHAVSSRPLIDVDLHMHTDHSRDCATPVEVLLATARARGLGAIAVTEHNEISGGLAAAAQAEGVKVIVGEEVKTDHQGEVIGLFLSEKIPRGMSLPETIAEIKRQGGLVYVPHPFDRMHSVPDYENLREVLDDIDLIEVFNPRVAIAEFNDEAVRFAARYRLVAGAGSDAHVPHGLGSVRIRMHDFDGPEEFLESLRDADIIRNPASLFYVQALKFLQTKAMPAGARKASRARRVRRATRTS